MTAPSSAWSCSTSTSASRASGSTADPEAAKQLVLEGQEQARQALAELRDLVRGIAPSILVDRGLVPALGSITGLGPGADRHPQRPCRPASGCRPRSSGPPTSSSPRRSRTSPSTAAPRRCEVRCRREGSRLVVEVWDDGVGGATVEPGGGLAGLAGRVAGVDGTFTVSSPAGGPTTVRATFPVAAWAPPTTGWVLPKR